MKAKKDKRNKEIRTQKEKQRDKQMVDNGNIHHKILCGNYFFNNIVKISTFEIATNDDNTWQCLNSGKIHFGFYDDQECSLGAHGHPPWQPPQSTYVGWYVGFLDSPWLPAQASSMAARSVPLHT